MKVVVSSGTKKHFFQKQIPKHLNQSSKFNPRITPMLKMAKEKNPMSKNGLAFYKIVNFVSNCICIKFQ